MDVHLDGVALDLFLPAIKAFLEIALGADRLRPLHQGGEDGKFAPRKADRLSRDRRMKGRRIEHDAVVRQTRGGPAGMATNDGPHACRELIQIEGLSEIVVRSGVKSPDTVGHLVKRRQQQHRGPIARGTDFCQQVESRSVRKHQIEHNGVEGRRAEGGIRVRARTHRVDGGAQQAEPCFQTVEQNRIIFNDENSHHALFLREPEWQASLKAALRCDGDVAVTLRPGIVMRNASLRTIIGLLAFVSVAAAHAQTPPSADRVFRLRVSPGTAGALVLNWTIAPGNYLYRDKIAAARAGGSAIEVSTDSGEIKDDPSFGQTEIYRDRAQAIVPAKLVPQDGDIVVTFQGCAERGICYPPVKKTVDPRTMSIVGGGAVSELNSSSERDPVQDTTAEISFAPHGGPASPAPEQARLHGNIVAVLLAFTGFGLLLAFTPCIFPMIPILSGMLARSGDRLTARRGFVLSGAYVLAMALAYAVLGVVVAWSGQNLQAALQTPAVLVSMSAVFLALAISMFGYYDLQIPQSWQARLTGKASSRSGSLGGAAIMGFGSALIVGPCVTPPLAAALVYVAQTGDVLRGASALFALGLGMGLPLLVFGTFGAGILPKSGPWLAHVKRLFGFVFVGLAIWIASRVLPDRVVAILWAALVGSAFAYLAAVAIPVPGQRRSRAVTATVGVLVVGIVLIGQSLAGSLRLPPGFGYASASGFIAAAEPAEFKTVTTPQALHDAIVRAKQTGRPIILDFSAKWCVECQVMDRTVFSDPTVSKRLRGFDLIRADATDYSDDSRSLMKRFGVVGPPTVIFLEAGNGREAADTRIIGPVDSSTFLSHLDHLPAS